MKLHTESHTYDLWQLGGGEQRLTIPNHETLRALIQIAANRTNYLDNVGGGLLACVETKDAYMYLEMATLIINEDLGEVKKVKIEIVDDGHIYNIHTENHGVQKVTFVKRSGEIIRHEKEWPGIQTQEVLRAIIHYIKKFYTKYTSEEIIEFLRMSLFMYEVRAYRRKQEGVNKKAPRHDDTGHPRSWRTLPFDDIPFNHHRIELRPIGPDGHILI